MFTLALARLSCYVCANFGENDKKCDREHVHRWIDRRSVANRFYSLPQAICYSYGADNKEE